MNPNALIRGEYQLRGKELDEVRRELCKSDLKFLCTQVLGFKDWDVCHDELAKWLDLNEDVNKMILLPRNHFKTSIITIGRTIQRLLRDPSTRILLTNAVWDNARSFLSEIKEYLANTDLPRLFGTFKSEKWNADEIVINQRVKPNKTPSIDTAGIEKVLTSQHYKWIVADDLVSRENVTTKEQMMKVKNFVSDLQKLADPRDGVVDVIGTHWHHADLYAQIMEENKIRLDRSERVLFNTYIRSATLDGTFETAPIFPKLFSIEKLKEIKFQIGSYDYNCNYNNIPSPEDARHFKPPHRYFNSLGQDPRYYIGVDLAIEEKKTSDYSVIMVCALTQSNQLCVVEYARGHFGTNEVMEKIFYFVVKYMAMQKSRRVAIESVAFQKVFAKMVEDECRARNLFFDVIKVVPHKDKVSRILGLQPRWESGNLLMKQGMSELEDELEKFPVGKHDDLLDALEMCNSICEPTTAGNGKVYIPRQYRRAW